MTPTHGTSSLTLLLLLVVSVVVIVVVVVVVVLCHTLDDKSNRRSLTLYQCINQPQPRAVVATLLYITLVTGNIFYIYGPTYVSDSAQFAAVTPS